MYALTQYIPMTTRLRALVCTGRFGALLALSFACLSACSSQTLHSGDEPSPPLGGGKEAGSAPGAEVLSVCIDTTCPAPFVTCPDTPLCTVDLDNDTKHCGSCEKKCPESPGSEEYSCVNGTCQFSCQDNYADCDGNPDNGCEASLLGDNANCGMCGRVCNDPDVGCLNGKCGCDKDFCGSWPFIECVDFATNPYNCGRCGKVCFGSLCTPLQSETTKNTVTGCEARECKKAECDSGWLDCDRDWNDATDCGTSNGCEVPIDEQNCGACGKVCPPSTACVKTFDGYDCFLLSQCSDPHDGVCADEAGGLYCTDLGTDLANCGVCGNACDTRNDSLLGGFYTSRDCIEGVCVTRCALGSADCDFDGLCETNLSNDPLNCGACGVACEYGQGQPCVRGACLTKPCSPEAGAEVPR